MKVSILKSRFMYWFFLLVVLSAFGQSANAVRQEWAAVYNSSGGASDYPKDIAVDLAGNIYVTGYGGSDGGGVITIKYNSSGAQQWVRTYNYNPGSNFLDRANSITVDSAGNVYVTGATDNGLNDYDILTIKYNTSGAFQWAALYNSATSSYDEGYDIAVNSGTGDVYVTGRSGTNLITIRYNSAGAQMFTSIYGGGCGYGIALNTSGDVYVTGNNMTIKLNSTLVTELWRAYYGGVDIALDSSGNAYVTGGIADCITVKYANTDGATLWTRTYDGGFNDSGNAIAVDSSGNAYVTGSTSTGGGTDYLTIMYDTSGTQQWVQTYNGGSADEAHGIAIDTETPPNVYVTGESQSVRYMYDFATIMYDNTGARQWVMKYNGLGNNWDKGQAIAVYNKDNIYVTGESTVYNFDYATVKYSQADAGTKWEQLPDMYVHHGIDVNASAPYILADDFNCTTTGKIREIAIWGSWIDDRLPGEDDANDIKFTLSIHDDIPADDPNNFDGYSKPGDILWTKQFIQGEFAAEKYGVYLEEGWMNPIYPEPNYIYQADSVCWRYIFPVDYNSAFTQTGEPNSPVIYWLDVQAEPNNPNDPNDEAAWFGWKTSYQHWNDDAVWGTGTEPYTDPWYELTYPYEHPNYPNSIDLAFAVTTRPDPTAFNWSQGAVDNWSNGNKWLDQFNLPIGSPPDGSAEVKIRYAGSVCTLNSVENWSTTVSNRVRVYNGAVLNIVPDGSLTGPGWFRVGTGDGPAAVNQTGGTLKLKKGRDSSRLVVGDSAGSAGSAYTVSSGTITYDNTDGGSGNLGIGDRGGSGTFTIAGSGSTIQMGSLHVPGPLNADLSTGNLEYMIDAGGVSPIDVNHTVLDAAGPNSLANLLVSFMATPPAGDIVLVKNRGVTAVAGVFDTCNGLPAPEGVPVLNYALTYVYDADGDGANNDIALLIADCLKPTAPEYADWVTWGRPDCWCCNRQCNGDINCTKTGPFWVQAGDLAIFKLAFNKTNAQLALIPNGICADLDHKQIGPFRVNLVDLVIFATWFNKPNVPCCDLNGDCILTPADKYNFWTN